MSQEGSSDWALNLVVSYARESGMVVEGARLLHHYSNAVALLPGEGLVVRLTGGPDALARIARSQAVCRWLVDVCGFPATEPARGLRPIVLADAMIASFWHYHRPPAQPVEVSSADLARLLRWLHDLGLPPVELPRWRPLMSLESVLASGAADRVLGGEDVAWLRVAVAATRQELDSCTWPLGIGLIHGDAWAGNLLVEQRAQLLIRLGDWDNVSIGPREVDLIPSWHASYRYGRGAAWRAAFRDQYGYDLQGWECFGLLMWMRDLVQLPGPILRAPHDRRYADALRQRLGDIQAGIDTTVWTAL